MDERARKLATLAIFVALFPALAAPSCGTPQAVTDVENAHPPVVVPGPAYGPIAVGARVPINTNSSPQIVSGDAFEISGGLLHALKPGTATVRFQTLAGPEDLNYQALAADSVDVSCPGGGTTCLVSATWQIQFPFTLFSGGKTGTKLVSGALCPFAATSSVPVKCEADLLEFTVQGGATGTITSTVDPAIRIDVEGVPVEAIDALQFSFTPLPGGASADVLIVASRAGTPMNVDRFQRQVNIDTTLLCGINGAQTDGISQGTVLGTGAANLAAAQVELWIYKKQAGDCAVSAQLVGSSVTASGRFTF
jgi:hypothetical protein